MTKPDGILLDRQGLMRRNEPPRLLMKASLLTWRQVYAYGPKTEVAKRYFFASDVLDATLMMGWGGVGWGMLTFV